MCTVKDLWRVYLKLLFLRTVKLCEPLKTGAYKLHVEAGGQKQTEEISVCVAGGSPYAFNFNSYFCNNIFIFFLQSTDFCFSDKPVFESKVDDENLTIETVSPTPAYTRILCLSPNVRYEYVTLTAAQFRCNFSPDYH